MATRKKIKPDQKPADYPLPTGISLTPESRKEWERFTRALPLNRGPGLFFALADSPVLRRSLAESMAKALEADSLPVVWLRFTQAYPQPLQEIFDATGRRPDAWFCFLFGLEYSLLSKEHRRSALTDLNLHRDQIKQRLACPLVIWTTDAVFTDIARNAPDFIAWRSGVYTFADPSSAVQTVYRQHVIDRHSKLTLYSSNADSPLAVDLERVFVKLTTTQKRTTVGRDLHIARRTFGPDNTDIEFESKLPERFAPRPEVGEEFTAVLSIGEALRSSRSLVVIGAPGSGKTTLLKYLALTFARYQAQERLGLEETRLPFMIALRDLSGYIASARKEMPSVDPGTLPRFLKKHTETIAPYLNLPDDFFARQLESGDCAVLMDGLDEVVDPARRSHIVELISACMGRYPGNRFIVTSRPRGYKYEGEAHRKLSPFCASCTIRDFDDNDMSEFARSWYEAVIRDLKGDSLDAIAEAHRQADDLLLAIRANEHIKALAHSPLLLSVLAMVHQRGVGLPQRRVELYDECTDMLLGYWDQVKGGETARDLSSYGGLSRTEKRSLLEPVALWLHERGKQGLEVSKDDLCLQVAGQFREIFRDDDLQARNRAEMFLRLIDERAGLLVERETGVYAFSHLTFQEYLAARAIADREDYIEYTLIHLHDFWWQEVILLEVGHLSDVRHFGKRSQKLTTDLIRATHDAGSWLEDVLKRDMLFAARCLADVGKLGVDEAIRSQVLHEIMSLWRATQFNLQRSLISSRISSILVAGHEIYIYAELIDCLENENLKLDAIDLLGEISEVAPSPGLPYKLLDLLHDSSLKVKTAAAEALGRVSRKTATKEIVEKMFELLSTDDSTDRYIALKAFARMNKRSLQKHIIEKVMTLVDDEDDSISWQAILTLTELDEPAYIEEFLAKILNMIANANGRAIFALEIMNKAAATPQVLERLIALTFHKDDDVRCIATEALYMIRKIITEKTHIDRLVQLTYDESLCVRRAAIEVLSGLEGYPDKALIAERLLELLEYLEKEERDLAQQTLSALVQGKIFPNISDKLIAMTKDERALIRAIAAETLGYLGGNMSNAIAHRLLELTFDKDTEVRREAAWTLCNKSPSTPKIVDRLLALTGDPDLSVRSNAVTALGLIDHHDSEAQRVNRLIALINDGSGLFSDVVDALELLSENTDTPAVLERLAAFWMSQLTNCEDIDKRRERKVNDIAYNALWWIAQHFSSQYVSPTNPLESQRG